MVKVIVELSDFEDRIVTIAKAHYGVASKSEAISEIVCDASGDFLTVKPELIAKLRKLDAGPKLRFKNAEELRKYLEKGYEPVGVRTKDVRNRRGSGSRARTAAVIQKKPAYA